MRTLIRAINNRVLPLFNIRIELASSYRLRQMERQRLDMLAASNVARTRIIQLAQFLKPQKAKGHSKVRMGDPSDGGYVCLDDFAGIDAAFSFGISNNVSWDHDIAERGIMVHQFDHTVDGPPRMHPNFRFENKRIGPKESAGVESISSLVARYPRNGRPSKVLKIDVEHDEWAIFSETPSKELENFSQIICEFHFFSNVIDDDWYIRARSVLERLNYGFGVVHVHANNCAPWMSIGNIPFPEVIEVTYANRMQYQFEPSEETFPTLLDYPNDPARPDFFLGRLEFLPPE